MPAPRRLRLMSRRIRAVVDEQPELEHGLHGLPDIGERLLWADPTERSTQRLGKRLLAGRFTKSVPEECGCEIHDKELVVFAVEKKHFVLERGGLNLRISFECHGPSLDNMDSALPGKCTSTKPVNRRRQPSSCICRFYCGPSCSTPFRQCNVQPPAQRSTVPGARRDGV